MPMREARKIYTKSEMFVMGWGSAETAYNMKNHTKQSQQGLTSTQGRGAVATSEEQRIEEALGPELLTRLVDEKGDVDLRRLTGVQLMKYMSAMRIPLGRS